MSTDTKILADDKATRAEKAREIAARYDTEAERETRWPWRDNYRRIAASYRQLAEEIAR